MQAFTVQMSLFNTQLKDRTLFYDGDTVVSPDHVLEFIDRGLSDFYVTEETEEIKQHNRYVSNPIKTKTSNRPLEFEWNIPEPHKSMDVVQHIIDLWAEDCNQNDHYTSDECDVRAMRVSDELHLYKDLQLLPILRAIIYIINTLQDKKIVWGVGRGSSVSSYILYLIGVHDVDSVKYELEITDFLRAPSK